MSSAATTSATHPRQGTKAVKIVGQMRHAKNTHLPTFVRGTSLVRLAKRGGVRRIPSHLIASGRKEAESMTRSILQELIYVAQYGGHRTINTKMLKLVLARRGTKFYMTQP